MTVVRFKNLNVGRSRPSNRFQTHTPKKISATTRRIHGYLFRQGHAQGSWSYDNGSRGQELAQDGPVLGSHEPIHVQRAAHDRFIDTNKPPIGKVEHLGLDGPHGTIPIRCYHPSKPGIAEGAALVYLMGALYRRVARSLRHRNAALRREQWGASLRGRLQARAGYQFSVQIEEDQFVVRWLHEHARRGIDPTRIALGGDSAGGTRVRRGPNRDERGPKLALQMPIYPEAALPFNTRAGVEDRSGSYVDTAGVLLFAWSYIPQGVDYSQPYITPLNAPSHADLPKTLLVTCGFDMLRDVAHAYGLSWPPPATT